MTSATLPLQYHLIYLPIQISVLLGHSRSPYSTFKLHGTKYKVNLVTKNIQSFERRLTAFLSSLKTFKLVNLMVERALLNLCLANYGVWMDLGIQVTRQSMAIICTRTYGIIMKQMNFYTITHQKPPQTLNPVDLDEIINHHKNQVSRNIIWQWYQILRISVKYRKKIEFINYNIANLTVITQGKQHIYETQNLNPLYWVIHLH